MIGNLLFFLVYLAAAFAVFAGIFVVGWMMLQGFNFIQIVMEIHSSASSRSYGHMFPLANFFDARVLNEKEKRLRDEGFGILSKLIPVFFGFGFVVVMIATFTS